MEESILKTIKGMIVGIDDGTDSFDLDLIVNINSCFSVLNQLGLGPNRGFKITGNTEVWSDFLGDDVDHLEDVKTYIYTRVRLVFDPPQNSFLTKSFEDLAKELEWRLNVAAETPGFEED